MRAGAAAGSSGARRGLDVPLTYDPDRWIVVPLAFEGTAWSDAEEWSCWLAEEATRGRPDRELMRRAVRQEALTLARVPSDDVVARFWHYPVDDAPTGFADLFVHIGAGDGVSAADLLPEPGATAVPPVIDSVDLPGTRSAVRRLSLGIGHVADRPEAVTPKAEWIAVQGEVVWYLVSVDFDVAPLHRRLADADLLFRANVTAATERRR